jgi:hypothetical protein
MTAHANQIETDYWRPDNTEAEYQMPILGQATSGSQDAYSSLLGFQKASYINIQYISLGYNLPKDLCTQMGFSNLKIYSQVVNPGSIYQSIDMFNLDTSLNRSGSTPAAPRTYYNRSFVFGLDFGF